MQNTNRTRTLRPYQIEGVERLIELTAKRGAALLADQPGLGKTIQVAEFTNRTRPESVLIVCPASLRINWQRELADWVRPEVAAATLLSVRSYEEVTKSEQPPVALAVFDEAHYLKNPSAKRTKACLAVKARRRLFLTGTPLVNRPMDLYPILSAMGIKLTRTEFGKRYCAGHLVTVRYRPTRRYAWDFSGASHIDELNAALRKHCMVRRTKEEVLTELPAKVRQIVELEIPDDGEPAALKEAVGRMFDGMAKAAENLAELKRLAFQELSAARLDIARAKLPYVLNFLQELLMEEDQIVVFAYHREIIDALAAAVPGAVKVYGGMADHVKAAAVDAFQSGQSPVFVGQLTAAGTGLTLTAAHTVLFAELDWVPGAITQAEDRLHRIGQHDTVRVIHLAAAGSVDAKMIHTLVEKQNIIERVMQ